MTCEPTQQNTAVYLQGVTVTTSSNIANEYFVTSTLPSAAPNRRVWSFMAQGTFTGPLSLETPSSFILDYTVARQNCPEFNISFDNALNGILILNNQEYSANRYLTYQQISLNVLLLSFRRFPRVCRNKTNYFFQIYLQDAASSSIAINIPNYISTYCYQPYPNASAIQFLWSYYPGNLCIQYQSTPPTPCSSVSSRCGSTSLTGSLTDFTDYIVVVAIDNLQTIPGNTNALTVSFQQTGILNALILTDASGNETSTFCNLNVVDTYTFTYAFSSTLNQWMWCLPSEMTMVIGIEGTSFATPCPFLAPSFTGTCEASTPGTTDPYAPPILNYLVYQEWEWVYFTEEGTNLFEVLQCTNCPNSTSPLPIAVLKIDLYNNTSPPLGTAYILNVVLDWGTVTDPSGYYIVKVTFQNSTSTTQCFTVNAYDSGTGILSQSLCLSVDTSGTSVPLAFINVDTASLDGSGNCIAPPTNTFYCYELDTTPNTATSCTTGATFCP